MGSGLLATTSSYQNDTVLSKRHRLEQSATEANKGSAARAEPQIQMQVAIFLSTPCQKLNRHYHHNALASSLSVIAGAKRLMVTIATTSSNNPGSFTTLRERVTFERQIKKSKFIAIAGPISDERSAQSFLNDVRDPRATHNCWAYKIGDQYRSNDDGEPSGTAGKPIYSAVVSSGLDRMMVVVIRYFGGIKLGTGGLVRAYGGVAAECLRNAPTCLVKSKVPMGLEVPFDLLGVLYHQVTLIQSVIGIKSGLSL
ncbi:unnamed protein product [Ilex paraguariensis]|uniref:Impact N-terminal domain-containing protein n=1 Tax=Ilex paraguariensis TaxID=185542 RepID=A0ABC8SLS0_9AQUA